MPLVTEQREKIIAGLSDQQLEALIFAIASIDGHSDEQIINNLLFIIRQIGYQFSQNARPRIFLVSFWLHQTRQSREANLRCVRKFDQKIH